MEVRTIDKVMFQRVKIGKIKFQVVDLVFILCLFMFAFMIRWKLMPVESADYWGFLEGWMTQIRSGGGFRSLSQSISNYTAPYMYLMCLVSYITDNDLYGLKMISVFFDYSAAAAVFLIIYEMSGNVKKSILGMSVLLLSPTVIFDGASWCQCDIIYTGFLF